MNTLEKILFLKALPRIGKQTINRVFLPRLATCASWHELNALARANFPKLNDEDCDKAHASADAIAQSVMNDRALTALTFDHPDYPKRLFDLGDKAPPVLYVRGAIDALRHPLLAVIGTRSPSEMSQNAIPSLMDILVSDAAPVVVSGLALGCDSLAQGYVARKGRPTVGVLAGGVNALATTHQRKLADEILANGGCLVSEYEPTVRQMQYRFLERDCLIAALAHKVFSIECEDASGTLYTLRQAAALHRPLAAFLPPGAGTVFDGNRIAIRDLRATPVATPEELGHFTK